MKLFKDFTLLFFSMFCFLYHSNVIAQSIEPFSSLGEYYFSDEGLGVFGLGNNNGISEIEILYCNETNQNYFIPICDENGELIQRYTITERNEAGDIIDSYKTHADNFNPIPLFSQYNGYNNFVVEADFLTVVADIDPTIILRSDLAEQSLIPSFRFTTAKNITYNPNGFSSLSACLAQIATAENIVVTDIDISLAYNSETNNCQDGSTTTSKNGWQFESIKHTDSYNSSNGFVTYTYSTINISPLSLRQIIQSFDIGYKVKISYRKNNESAMRNSNMNQCYFQTLQCIPPSSLGKNYLENIQQLNFNIFPNPCQNYTNIAYTLAEDSEVYIEVYNIQGEQVACVNNNKYLLAGEYRAEIDMSHVVNGTYICSVSQSNGEVASQRFVKMQ